MNEAFEDLGWGITCIDTGYHRAQFAACYLIVENGRAGFVDTGTAHSVPRLLEALHRAGVRREYVDYVMPTHVHLDHAGGAGELMQHLPHAKLVLHPRGAPHLVDPAKLTAGATAVYGEAGFRQSFGELVPVPQERVIVAADGFELSLGGRRLVFLDTPGHAAHHYCVWDETSRGFFTGDTFGIAYPAFRVEGRPYLFPPTTPVQFDPAAWHATLTRLLSHEPERMYLTHFGRVDGDLPQLAGDLHRRIDRYAELARHAHGADNRYLAIRKHLTQVFVEEILAHGGELPARDIEALLEMDIDLNAQGLEVWLARQDKAAQ